MVSLADGHQDAGQALDSEDRLLTLWSLPQGACKIQNRRETTIMGGREGGKESCQPLFQFSFSPGGGGLLLGRRVGFVGSGKGIAMQLFWGEVPGKEAAQEST